MHCPTGNKKEKQAYSADGTDAEGPYYFGHCHPLPGVKMEFNDNLLAVIESSENQDE